MVAEKCDCGMEKTHEGRVCPHCDLGRCVSRTRFIPLVEFIKQGSFIDIPWSDDCDQCEAMLVAMARRLEE